MLIESNGPIDHRTEQQRVRDDIRDYLKTHKISNKSVAEKLGISPAMFSYYFSGKTFIPEAIAHKLNKLFGFDEYFLTKGSVEFCLDNDDVEVPIIHSLLPTEEYYVEEIGDLSKDDIIQMIQELQKKMKLLQKKNEIAEEAIYSANRMLLSSKEILGAITQYIESSKAQL